jgi:hypothetical protein
MGMLLSPPLREMRKFPVANGASAALLSGTLAVTVVSGWLTVTDTLDVTLNSPSVARQPMT